MPNVPTISDHVARLVSEAPPLTPEQIARLSALFRPPTPSQVRPAA